MAKLKKEKSQEPEVIKFAGKEVKVTEKQDTAFQEQLAAEAEEKDKLPIDKIVDIAEKAGILEGATKEERWNKFIKNIRLHDIVHDCMQSALNNFCKYHNEKYPDEGLKFKLHIRKKNKDGKIFGVELVLEMRRYDSYSIVLNKYIGFDHVRQVREETTWKYALFGAMYNELMDTALTFILINHDVNTGRIKPDVSAGESKEVQDSMVSEGGTRDSSSIRQAQPKDSV